MKENPVKILLIEDNPAEARLLEEYLKAAKCKRFSLVQVKRLTSAIDLLATEKVYDVILLDLTLPDSTGLGSLDSLSKQAPSLPIVVLTNRDDDELATQAVRGGAQDYLVKRQVNTPLLVRSINYAIERKQVSEELRIAKEKLEERVKERTAQLVAANEQLKGEIRDRLDAEQALLQEKELAQITLQSIGDAVIATDADGRVESINSVAESLTGWKTLTAKGRPLSEVFQIFDQTTGQEAENPIAKVLDTGCMRPPVNHTMLKSRDGQEFFIEHSAAPIYLTNGKMMGTVLVARDMTHAYQLADELYWQATHDSLTGLTNRREFERCLEKALNNAKTKNQHHVLCCLDLDQFKIVNDTCGHAAGDRLLRQLSSLLQSKLRPKDLLARLGGDEFGLLLYESSLEEGRTVATLLLDSIGTFRFVWQDKTFTVGVSIGVVAIDSSVESCATVLSAADTAMYAAKDGGRNRVHVYERGDRDFAQRHGDMQWVSRIVKALEENRFCLYSQVIAPISASTDYHRELLLRMYDEDGQLVPPMAFIPAAERYNLMPAIDRWVVRTLFYYLSLTDNRGENRYAVNLSAVSLNDDQFLDFLIELFDLYQVPPQQICFEITETTAIANMNKAVHFIRELKQLGCYFALDDFGSGMSSFAYLKNLSVDYLKIDRHFVKNIVEDPIDAAMIEAINSIGHIMGLQTIAEGVENSAILEKLRLLGVDYVQGYGIAKPCPLPSHFDHAVPGYPLACPIPSGPLQIAF